VRTLQPQVKSVATIVTYLEWIGEPFGPLISTHILHLLVSAKGTYIIVHIVRPLQDNPRRNSTRRYKISIIAWLLLFLSLVVILTIEHRVRILEEDVRTKDERLGVMVLAVHGIRIDR
jgi:hypothetical protein